MNEKLIILMFADTHTDTHRHTLAASQTKEKLFIILYKKKLSKAAQSG